MTNHASTTNQATPSILDKIIQTKHQEVIALKQNSDTKALFARAEQYRPKGFANALAQSHPRAGIIAEVKKASPSKGVICPNFDPVVAAIGYEKAGATCLSVLTDKPYFQGDKADLVAVRQAVNLPILRKDFIIDPIQILESRAIGADCILLIMACLNDDTYHTLHAYASSLGLDILVEIHNENELERALTLPNPKATNTVYGINNRNLNTFEVDLATSTALSKELKTRLGKHSVIVSESGIHTAQDIAYLKTNDIHHFLIGEQFMKTGNAGQALQKLLDQL